MGLREKPVHHGDDHKLGGPDPIPGMAGTVEVTDGVTTIDPVAVLRVGPGLVLTNPTTAEAEIEAFVPLVVQYQGLGVTPVSGAEATEQFDGPALGSTALLDISTPTAPTFLEDGIYAISAQFGSNGVSFVAGDMMQATIAVASPFSGIWTMKDDDSYPLRGSPSTASLEVHLGGVFPIAAGATITAKIFNGAAGTYGFAMGLCSIVKLGTY